MTVISLTPGIREDIEKYQDHPFAQYRVEDVNEQYWELSAEYSDIYSLIYSTARKIICSNLLEELYRVGFVARVWEDFHKGISTSHPRIHDNHGRKTSISGQWIYYYASLDPARLFISQPMYTTIIKEVQGELQYYSVVKLDYISSTEIVNSEEKAMYNLVFPGNEEMFRKDVHYIIPTSLLL